MYKTLKPAMMIFEASPDFRRVIAKLPSEATERVMMDLRTIREQVGDISDIVGELTIAIHQYTGDVFLLDFAPDATGRTGGEELAGNADRGLVKMIR